MPRTPQRPRRWSVAQARARLPEVFAAAAHEPQQVYRRDRPVAVVVSPRAFGELEVQRVAHTAGTLADAFAELRSIGGRIAATRRRNRRNAFDDTA